MNASDGSNYPNENNLNPCRSNDQRKGKGRQKLSMEKIEKEKNLQVTFSKRRAGIFKKASELNTLCGAESAIIIFSPGEKVHSYGHPSVEAIESRFLKTNMGPTPPTNPLLAAHREASNRQLNQELVNMEKLLEQEKQRQMELKNMFRLNINDLDYQQLKRLKKDVLEFKEIFESRFKDTTSSRVITLTNPQQGGPFDMMMGCPNSGDSTHWAPSSASSYPNHFDPNMRYQMFQFPYGSIGSAHDVAGSGAATSSNVLIPYNFKNSDGVAAVIRNTTASTSNTKAGDQPQPNI